MTLPEHLPEILVFDVFGTVVNWHGTVSREVSSLLPSVDSAEFARSWRAKYAPSMTAVMDSGRWVGLDELHLANLRATLVEYNVTSLSEEQILELNQVWHRLEPWPDSPAALRRLKKKFIISTLSNGGVALLTHMAKKGDLDWDVILSAEIFKAYKPDERAYKGVGRIMGVPDNKVMMVAAHHNDLDAAQDAGLRTAYIERPVEFGADRPKDVARRERHPLHFGDIGQLADYFGC